MHVPRGGKSKMEWSVAPMIPIILRDQTATIHLHSEYSLTQMIGKNNIAIGFLTMGFFMAYGFLLIYLRDFAPGKEDWVNSYSIGKHFEARLAHVHGNLWEYLSQR